MVEPNGRCVLLADGSHGSALQAARVLHAQGIRVRIACADVGADIMSRSKACDESIDLPAADSATYIRLLREWLRSDRDVPTVIVPLSDRTVDWLDRHRDSFTRTQMLAIPPSDVLGPLLDKTQASAIAAGAGLAVLPWRRVADVSDLFDVTSLTLPVIVRPSGWESLGASYFKQAVFWDHPSLHDFLIDRLDQGAIMIVQEFVRVPPDAIEFAIVACALSGDVLSLVTGRKRATSDADGGVLAWGEATPLPDVSAACEAFVQASGFQGAGGLEVIRWQGKLWFVEFNPRAEAIHFLSDLAGAPNIWAVVASRLGLPIHVGEEQRSAAIWVEAAWLSSPHSAKRRLADIRIAYRQFRNHSNRAMAIASAKDPGPALAYAWSLLRRIPHTVRSQRINTRRRAPA
jgi:predicted ATP-grasp superfamily ATP-dependent carboligase